MKTSEIRNMTVQEIERKIVELEDKLFTLRFQHVTTKTDTPHMYGDTRKDIARLKTILTEKARQEA